MTHKNEYEISRTFEDIFGPIYAAWGDFQNFRGLYLYYYDRQVSQYIIH